MISRFGLTDNAAIDADLLRRVHEDPRNALHSTSAQAQMLLKAFESFVIPLVHVLDGRDKKEKNNADSDSWSSEGEEFLIALQKFVTAIIRSQFEDQDPVDENVEGGSEAFPGTASSTLVAFPKHHTGPRDIAKHTTQVIGAGVITSQVGTEPSASTTRAATVIGGNSNNENTSMLSQQATSGQKIMAALRQHVYNSMPIRLLCFKPEGSKYNITLLERGDIYAYLESQLRAKFRREHFLSDIEKDAFGQANIFTEERMIKTWVAKHARYAILSHTWIYAEPGEVTFGDWHKGPLDPRQPGAEKLVNFCKVAAEDHGLTLGWMDTICINKESSAELDESIRSMYKWYMQANVCITHLSQTTAISDMHADPWFTRGWTLQELIAPPYIKFYNKSWERLSVSSDNDKNDAEIQEQIRLATTITAYELNPHTVTPFSRRMQRASTRKVTREEDTAYSLMGIFRVSISIAYGEGGKQAFFRLVKEILSSHRDVIDIFNWAGSFPSGTTNSCLIPPSPQAYLHSQNTRFIGNIGGIIKPITLTHLGLRIPILLMPALSSLYSTAPELQYDPSGDYYATVKIKALSSLQRDIPNTYDLLDKGVSGRDGWTKDQNRFQMTFGALTFGGNETHITVPKTCLAVGLECLEDSGRVTSSGPFRKIQTEVPIVFDINTKGYEHSLIHYTGYSIQRSQLADHGMQLVTMYL